MRAEISDEVDDDDNTVADIGFRMDRSDYR